MSTVPRWSRDGCLTCKARKRKCDEQKPFCKECLRINMACVYPADSAAAAAAKRRDAVGKDSIGGFLGHPPTPGLPPMVPLSHNETRVAGLGVVKILRAKVEYKIENGQVVYKA